jgi:ribosomal protein S18 acetylase RimI-like enzyme
MAIVIRDATPADAAALAALARRTFLEQFAADNDPRDVAAYVAVTYGEALQRSEIADPAARVRLAFDGEVMAAYAYLCRGALPHPDAAVAWGAAGAPTAPVKLARFYVDRPWQGRGLAADLLSDAVTVARGWGGDRLWLTVWEHNPRAIRFYEKHGFTVAGQTPYPFGAVVQTDLLMQRGV